MWKNRALIPNIDGLHIEVRLVDGSVCPARVKRGADGLHRLDGIAITNVNAWRMPG